MIELPFPAKILWPNGRTRNVRYRAAAARQHKNWAYIATLAVKPPVDSLPVRLVAIFHPKTAHAIDSDNAVASLKHYQDGIAAALKIDDKHFGTPVVFFAEPIKGGRVNITVEAI